MIATESGAAPEHGPHVEAGSAWRIILGGVAEGLEDAVAVVGPVRVEIQRRRRRSWPITRCTMFGRHPVVHEPGGVGVAEIVVAQSARLV